MVRRMNAIMLGELISRGVRLTERERDIVEVCALIAESEMIKESRRRDYEELRDNLRMLRRF